MEDGLRTVMKEYIDQVDDVCLRLLDGLCLKSKADFLCSRKLRWGIEYETNGTKMCIRDSCYSEDAKNLKLVEAGWLVCREGLCAGVFETLPEEYASYPVTDCGDQIITPGLVDLHVHAPQYAFRGLGMDLELLDWLNTNTFPEESKYRDLEYAKSAYGIFADSMRSSATTRACIFATIHNQATKLLMDLMEETGLKTMIGKVNMDRNSPEYLCEESAEDVYKRQIYTRVGAHCAPLMHRALGTESTGAVRFSMSHFNTEAEIDEAVRAVHEIAEG